MKRMLLILATFAAVTSFAAAATIADVGFEDADTRDL